VVMSWLPKSSMRQPEFEALDTLEAPIREGPKEGPKEANASGRNLCDGSGRRFFCRVERDKEGVRIIGFGVEVQAIPSCSFFWSLRSEFLCLNDRSSLISTKLMTFLSDSF
jgi:hypothetical protein